LKDKNLFLAIAVLFFLSCYSRPAYPLDEIDAELQTENETEIKTDVVKETKKEPKKITKKEIKIEADVPVSYSLTLTAVGDNLYHNSMITSSLIDGVYNFAPVYSEIKKLVENSDIAFINQETPMAGTSYGYTGYPVFNSPQTLAHALVETGFDVFNFANNHAMDMRAQGLYATLDFFETIEGITVIGARRAGESARIITKNNISLGFLAYTFGVNSYTIPSNNTNLVSLIDRPKMKEEIEALRPLCDFLIVSMHWGEEYMQEPSREQISLAQFLAELNVDLIIGHHPHVLQRVDTITLPDGRKTICYYSLGNLVTHQLEWERLIGGMAVVTFTKEGIRSATGEVTWSEENSITDFGMIPLVTHFDRSFRNTKVYPLYAYTEELLAVHGLRWRAAGPITLNFFNNVLNRMKVKIITEYPFAEDE